jgi:hypothetical protein
MAYYDDWVSFEQWAGDRGFMRAAFWATQGWANPERARYAHWVLKQRHWREEPYLHEFMVDLSADLLSPKRRKSKRRK